MKLVYVDCQICGDDLPYALAPGSLHRIYHPKCRGRFLVSISPQGEPSNYRRLDPNESWESAIRELYPEHVDQVVEGVKALEEARGEAS